MSSEHRLVDYLDDMVDAARQACAYVDGLGKTGFIADRRTQQAVILNLVILGEAATRVLARHADFVALHPQVPWHNMRGMRNRVAHGYFDLDIDVVWDTVQSSLPALLAQLPAVRNAAALLDESDEPGA